MAQNHGLEIRPNPIKRACDTVKSKNDKVIRGRFRLGENALPSSKDKREKIMRDLERIMRKGSHVVKKEKYMDNE